MILSPTSTICVSENDDLKVPERRGRRRPEQPRVWISPLTDVPGENYWAIILILSGHISATTS